MNAAYRRLAPLCLLTCAAACDLSPSDDDDTTAEDDGSESGSDPTGETDMPGTSADASSDPSGSDPSGADPTGDPSGPDTGAPGDALPDSVLLYIHADAGNADSVRAYDVATGESWVVTDFGGNVEVRSVAIHPSRTSLAIASFYELQTAEESEGIWRVPAAGGTPEPIMAAIDGDEGEFQSVANLAYTYDGSEIYFDYSSSTTGGGTLARVADGGGLPELLLDSGGTCSAQAAPAPGPSGTQLLAVRDGCIDVAQEGVILHDLPPGNAGQVVIPVGDIYELPLVAPQWSADGLGVIFQIMTRIDLEGDGFYDGQGESLQLWDTQSGQVYEVVPPAIEQRIYGFAVSPDETGIVMVMGSAAGQDLVLLDLSGASASYRTLTSDGQNVAVAW